MGLGYQLTAAVEILIYLAVEQANTWTMKEKENHLPARSASKFYMLRETCQESTLMDGDD
jgi:hypothetical protein